MDQLVVENVLACRFCGKPAKSKSGNTLHEKTCPKAANNCEDVSVSTSTAANPYQDRIPESRRQGAFGQDASDRPERSHDRSGGGMKAPFQFGAFFIMADHVPILLDIDFCIALGNQILEHGSPNSAIMAFAHQLKKLDDD
jgi:hypothetical protein